MQKQLFSKDEVGPEPAKAAPAGTWRYASKAMQPRRARDAYYMRDAMPKAVVEQIVKPRLPDVRTCIDPGCGDGAWGNAVGENYGMFCRIIGCDLDTRLCRDLHFSVLRYGDYLTMPWYEDVDLVIGNPPYGALAEKFVYRSLELVREGGLVVFLLLLSFLGSQSRYHRMFGPTGTARPIEVWTLSKRPGFSGYSGTDAREYGIFVWQRGENPPSYDGKWLIY
jgi:hypothetical protein